jgi:VNT family MFS transporter (synaptic vesicle glycoprotein 2)
MCWQAGFGYSQWLLMVVSGLGLVADAAELLVIPFILPSAEVELCINASQKTWLSKYCSVVLVTALILVFVYCEQGSASDRITNCFS